MAGGRQRRPGARPGELRLELPRSWSGFAQARRSQTTPRPPTSPGTPFCSRRDSLLPLILTQAGPSSGSPRVPGTRHTAWVQTLTARGGRGAGVPRGNAGAGQAPRDPRGEGRLSALKCQLPPSRRRGIQPWPPRGRSPRACAPKPSSGHRRGRPREGFSHVAEGAEGPVYWPALGLQELGEPEEAEVTKLSGRLVSSKSRSGFAVIDFLPGRIEGRVTVSCPPSLLSSLRPEARPPAQADPGTHPIAATQTGRCSR